jgi:hypothetical protein
MYAAFLYLVVLVFSYVIGAGLGNAAGMLFGVITNAEYGRRFVRGLAFGSATVTASVYLLRWFARPVHPAFLAVLVSILGVLTLSNYVKVKTAMRTHQNNATAYVKLSELSRTRLLQDLTAVMSALISSLIAYGRVD